MRATLGYFTEPSYFLETAVMPNLPPGLQETRTDKQGRFVLSSWADTSPVRYLEARGPGGGATWPVVKATPVAPSASTIVDPARRRAMLALRRRGLRANAGGGRLSPSAGCPEANPLLRLGLLLRPSTTSPPHPPSFSRC